VRLAAYIQAIIAIIPVMLVQMTFAKREVDKRETTNEGEEKKLDNKSLRRMRASTYTVATAGIALLIVAFVTHSQKQLTLYHASIVLNLSWINNITAYINVFGSRSIFRIRGNLGRFTLVKTREFLVYLLHFILTGAFGITVFRNTSAFSPDPGCDAQTVYWVFGRFVDASSPSLAHFWVGISSIAVVPMLNWGLFSFATGVLIGVPLFVIITQPLLWLIRLPAKKGEPAPEILGAPFRIFVVAFRPIVLGAFVCLIFLIASTEKTIAGNFVGAGEGQWGFGQILSLLLVAVPAAELPNDIRRTLSTYRAIGE